MLNLFRRDRLAGCFACVALGCLAVAPNSAAQNTAPGSPPIVLSAKAATKLVRFRVKPEYPPVAKENYIQGKVRLQLLVSSEGKVTQANAMQGNALLAASALRTVHQWLYSPLQTSAGAVPFVTVVNVNFSLRNSNIKNHFPSRPERDFDRQIHPPAMLNAPPAHLPSLHLRVLVSDSGQALDVSPVQDFPARYASTLKLVERCKFRPAHWGSLPVPWYLDVEVPALNHPAVADGPGGK